MKLASLIAVLLLSIQSFAATEMLIDITNTDQKHYLKPKETVTVYSDGTVTLNESVTSAQIVTLVATLPKQAVAAIKADIASLKVEELIQYGDQCSEKDAQLTSVTRVSTGDRKPPVTIRKENYCGATESISMMKSAADITAITVNLRALANALTYRMRATGQFSPSKRW